MSDGSIAPSCPKWLERLLGTGQITKAFARTWGRIALVTATVAMMLAAVDLSGVRSMLVPEVGAVSAGLLLFRTPSWRSQPLQIYLMLVGAGFLGIEISRYLQEPEIIKIWLTLATIVLSILVLRVPALPAISAGLLPVYLGLSSPLYVVAVAAFMAPPVMLVLAIERPALASNAPLGLAKLETKVLIGSLSLMVAAAWLFGTPLAVLPPLLVATAEGAAEAESTRLPVAMTRALLLGAGVETSIILYLATGSLFSVLATVAAMAYVAFRLGLYSPPLLAMSIIPVVFNRSEDQVIAALVPAGIVLSQLLPLLLARMAALLARRQSRLERVT